MARGLKKYWILLAVVLIAAVACGSDDPEPTATPVPTETPVPSIDIDELGIDTGQLDSLGITEADLQCLAVEVEAEILKQLFVDDLTPADALSVVPALQACNVDLAQLITDADNLLAESAGLDYQGLDSLPFTAEQIACIILVVDAETLENLVGGEATMASIGPVLEAFSACGIGLAELLAIAAETGAESTLDGVSDGDLPIDIPQLLPGALDVPDIPGIVETDDITDLADIASDLPFTAEQMECLSEEIDLEQITALASGEVDPLRMLSLISVLSSCGVGLDDLGN